MLWDGGVIFTSDDQLATIMRQIYARARKRYHHIRIGVNSRLDTLQAAILRVKLKHFDHELVLRQKEAEKYNIQYAASDIITPKVMADRTHVYGQYAVRVENRDQFCRSS